MKLVSTNLTNLVALEQFHLKPTGVYGGANLRRFVFALLHWHKVCELGGDKLQRAPVVALSEFPFRQKCQITQRVEREMEKKITHYTGALNQILLL